MLLLPFAPWASHLQFWTEDSPPASYSKGQPALCSDLCAQQNPCDDIWDMGLRNKCLLILPGELHCSRGCRCLLLWHAAWLYPCTLQNGAVLPVTTCSTNLTGGCSFRGQRPDFHDMPAVPWEQAGTLSPPMENGARAQLGAAVLTLAQGGHIP